VRERNDERPTALLAALRAAIGTSCANEALVRRGSDRRRYAVAYACSLLIHAVALVLAVLFVARAIFSGEIVPPQAALAPDATIVVTPPSPPPTALPTVAPKRRPPVPVAPRHLVRAPRPVPPPHHELARNVRNATPQPSAAPIATVVPAAPVPRRVAVVPSAAPVATAPPTVVPTLPPTPEPTLPPTPEPTLPPTPEPTLRPTPEPTARPTVEPTAPPTPEPTARPTPEPTARPTSEPTARPTAQPTARPTAEATARPTAAPTAGATAHPLAVATPAHAAATLPRGAVPSAVSATSAAARTGGHATAPHVAVAAPAAAGPPAPAQRIAPAPTAPASAAPVSSSLASLNARMKALLPTGAAGGMAAIDMGTYHTDRVLDAYEASLAPPLEVLLKTFGLIYTKRTATQADSIAYVYERTRILGVDVCRAYTIVEHPLREVAPNADHLGPAGQAMSGRPAALAFPGPLGDVKPQISTETVPCNAKGMIPVVPGSMHSPAPRRLGSTE
jgi:hypothetical protein